MKAGRLVFMVVLGGFLSSAGLPPAMSAHREAGSQRPPAPRKVQGKEAEDLASFLESSPALKQHIVWVTGDGKRQPFDEWTPAMKERIEEFYRRLLTQNRDLGMRLPRTLNLSTTAGRAYFTADQAFDIYAAHVAHVIFVEARHLVPWSIQSRPAVELEQLLASGSYFARIRPAPNNHYPAGIQANRDFAETPENEGLGEMNGDPRVGYDFLSGKTSASHTSLIGKTELETLVNLTAWLHNDVDHGPMDDKKIERVNQQRWLEDRLRGLPAGKIAIAIEGCHSASKLMVDLARSVNIPLLHTRALDNKKGNGASHFFNRTHGGLVYGWGGSSPRIAWHTDEIYAMPGRICFPIDAGTGALATPQQAAQQYFDEIWVSPKTLAAAGFVYHLERVLPEKGYGHHSRGKSEDRYDYGMMSGYWKKKGDSQVEDIYQLSHDAALCSGPLLQLASRGHGLKGQLSSNIKKWKGDFTDEELPLLRPIADYADRAGACLKAIGGAEKLDDMIAQAKSSRGKNLLVQR